jgi:hypothetical protein
MDTPGGVSPEEVRSLIETSWVVQEESTRALEEMQRQRLAGGDPRELEWVGAHLLSIASRLRTILTPIANETIAGRWAIGQSVPVCTSAGLVRTIDVTKAPTANHVWRYLGLAGSNAPGPGAANLARAIERDLRRLGPTTHYGALLQDRELTMRRVVRQFIGHYHAVAYYELYRKAPESPYPASLPDSDARVIVPGWPFS